MKYPLRNLKTRDPNDFAIALLDAWATVGDVLTFYQERIANEGYLRTATERRSILELARLIGYTLRPGVASTVYLAYTLDEDKSLTPPKPTATTIPKGSRAQSVPGPGELPQTFETSCDLDAHSKWNNLRVRLAQPQTERSIRNEFEIDPEKSGPRIYLKGIATNLKPNDPILIDFGIGPPAPELFRVIEVKPDAPANRTLVKLQQWTPAVTKSAIRPKTVPQRIIGTSNLLKPLVKPASIPPSSSAYLSRDLRTSFASKADSGLQLLSSFQPALADALPAALASATVTHDTNIKVYALRVKAAPFGNNAPKRVSVGPKTGEMTVIGEWPVVEWPLRDKETVADKPILHEDEDVIYLDSSNESIIADSALNRSWIVIDSSAWHFDQTTDPDPQVRLPNVQPPIVTTIKEVQSDISRADYGITGKTVRIKLVSPWLKIAPRDPKKLNVKDLQPIYDVDFRVIRSSAVYVQSEELPLADEPITRPVCNGKDNPIELDGLYTDLQSGRWLIVAGERTDVLGTSGVKAAELVMLAGVEHKVKKAKLRAGTRKRSALPGDRVHTFIRLSDKLAYCYKRDAVTIYGNVVKASHGETRKEVLGSGDGRKALQQFALRQSPLTFVSAANPTGVDSTLVARVNEVEWYETNSLADLLQTDRNFITQTDDDDKTTLIFGNGQHGARLPTGLENVKAVYRNGIGKPGNVKDGQISLLVTQPLHVKEVINPLAATGGADKDSRDQARENAPLAVLSLDRLVSTPDYADFARTFAGIGKASAARLWDGQHQLVHVTIAGVDDIPIEKTSELYHNLVQALHDYGDPYLPIQVDVRRLLALVLSASVRVLPDYQWESVENEIRATVLDVFNFERRAFGQDALVSEAISIIQQVEGVAYVDVDVFGGIPSVDSATGNPLTPEQISAKVKELAADPTSPYSRVEVALAQKEEGGIQPAQLAFFVPDVAGTLILNEMTQ